MEQKQNRADFSLCKVFVHHYDKKIKYLGSSITNMLHNILPNQCQHIAKYILEQLKYILKCIRIRMIVYIFHTYIVQCIW